MRISAVSIYWEPQETGTDISTQGLKSIGRSFLQGYFLGPMEQHFHLPDTWSVKRTVLPSIVPWAMITLSTKSISPSQGSRALQGEVVRGQ